MKPAENLINNFKKYISIFKNNEREVEYLKYVNDLPYYLLMVNFFNDKINIENIKINNQNELKNILIDFAHNYTLMLWGKDFIGKEEQLFERIPVLSPLKDSNDIELMCLALKVIVEKTVDYCYENSYKSKYFNEYIVNFKNQQYYLSGDKQINPVVAFDLDGTVVNSNERIKKMQDDKNNLSNSLDKKEKSKKKFKIMQEFHSNVDTDRPYSHMVELIHSYKKEGFDIMILTARPNEYIELNKEFLNKYNIPIDIYVGRPLDNGMVDTEGKYTWLNENVAKERVRGFFEDRIEIIEYFKKKEKVHIYDVDILHKTPTSEKIKSLVSDCLKRKNICEEYFLLKNEKENYKLFYKKAEEYYEKKNGFPFSEAERKRLELRNYKFKPNIS